MPSPPRWDLVLPQELFNIDVTSTLLGTQPSMTASATGWEDPITGTAWTADGDSESPPFTAGGFDAGSPLSDEIAFAMQGPAAPQKDVLARLNIADLAPTPSAALIQTPQHLFQGGPREVFNLPTALSEYFFREVISLYCAWDSKSNVMRHIVETMWQSSGALHHTIQSMAAACLSEDFPHLLPVARSEHSQALQLIHAQPPSPTHKQAMLLASTLLGHTSSWLAPQNLATDMFRASCSMLKDITSEAAKDASWSFFSDTMDYWAMLLVYLTDSKQLGDYRRDSSVGPAEPARSIDPHPYSGISHETVRMLTDTGILIFQYRKHMSKVKFLTEHDLNIFRDALREARRLERILLGHKTPNLTHVRDPGDPRTPLRHLELIDEAYRCTGLLQLYRVFPDLLNERYAPWDKELLLRPIPSGDTPTLQERQAWLTKLAMHILGILREIPFESRTRSAQPFIMVAISSELRRDPRHLRATGLDVDSVVIDPAAIEVARARKFIGSRLAAYTHILPLRKSQVISELIRHIWSALDAGEEDVYWLDVAYEKNLGTMMG